ncbi:hypothetical protein ABKN59_009273 [Abortiporus biennis]
MLRSEHRSGLLHEDIIYITHILHTSHPHPDQHAVSTRRQRAFFVLGSTPLEHPGTSWRTASNDNTLNSHIWLILAGTHRHSEGSSWVKRYSRIHLTFQSVEDFCMNTMDTDRP